MRDKRRARVLEYEITEELAQLHSEFTPNSLAYLLLTSKSERLLCGALASRLHARFIDFPGELICREWESFDVAVLHDGEPDTLIEAKAAYTFDLKDKNKRLYPSKPVRDDIDKLRKFEFNGDRYVLVFFTHADQIPERRYDAAIKYIKSMRRRGNDLDEFAECFRQFHERIDQIPIVAQGEIEAGNAFNVDVRVLYYLFDAS